MASSIKAVNLNLSEIPRLFNLDHVTELCARDIIAYIRGNIEENPWEPVVISYKGKPIDPDELEGSAIYWKDYNDNKIKNTFGLSIYTYCVISWKDLNLEDEDCGLNSILAEFRQKYNIHTFDILIVGKNDGPDGDSLKVLTKLRDYVRVSERDDVIFPNFIIRQNKKLANGLDIDPYAKEIEHRSFDNSLDAVYLNNILNKIAKEINPDSTVIQDLDGRRTRTIKLLITYLCLKHNLPPIYVSSFIADYLRFKFFYPRTKLSLFERVAFMRKLPGAVGYISANQSFHCLAAVVKKLYPAPHYVFDLDNQTLVTNIEDFTLDSKELIFFDYRKMFADSQYSISLSGKQRTNIARVNNGGDAEADRKLVDIFTKLTCLVEDEPVFLSIKNTVIVMKNSRRYLVYCPEEFGVTLQMVSEYIGQYVTVVPEGEFYRLIDAQLEKALLEKDRAATPIQASTALATTWRKWDPNKALRPALPLEVSLFMYLLPLYRNGLSYYDKALRCSADVLPIITSFDSPNRDVNPLFEEIALDSLRRDPQARYAINSFGTTTTYKGQVPIVPITYNAFEQRRLL